MSRTGIKISISDTILGNAAVVNANSLLVVAGATATTGGSIAFTLGTSYMLQSANDLETYGITEDNNAALYNQVTDYYAPKALVNNSGGILWIVGVANNAAIVSTLEDAVRQTTAQKAEYRPRQLLLYQTVDGTSVTQAAVQAVIDTLYEDGYCTVAVLGSVALAGNIKTLYSTIADLSMASGPLVGTVICTNRAGDGACVGAIGGFIASLSIGTSVGDMSLTQFGTPLYFLDYDDTDPINTPCGEISDAIANILGDKQYIFARSRFPLSGLWWNDGATANENTNSLSTIEAGRTIAQLCDGLREFFIRYLNTKVPVNADGDIDPSYREVVLAKATEQVTQPYIDSGDLSGATMDLRAKNNDMVGTRTWEVTLRVQRSPTLEWVDGYVFYVKSLND